jgi:hypothetical protein
MYSNLYVEMVRRNVTKQDIAALINRSYDTVCQKITRDTSFTLDEALTIYKTYFDDMNFKYLFAGEGKGAQL